MASSLIQIIGNRLSHRPLHTSGLGSSFPALFITGFLQWAKLYLKTSTERMFFLLHTAVDAFMLCPFVLLWDALKVAGIWCVFEHFNKGWYCCMWRGCELLTLFLCLFQVSAAEGTDERMKSSSSPYLLLSKWTSVVRAWGLSEHWACVHSWCHLRFHAILCKFCLLFIKFQ